MYFTKIQPLNFIVVLMILHSTILFSQSSANQWSASLLNTWYSREKITPNVGQEALILGTVSSWELTGSKRLGSIIDTNGCYELQLGYGTNSFAYNIDIRQSDYPFLRDNWQSRNKQNIHGYWVLGVSGQYHINAKVFVRFSLLNRIYRSARSGFTAESFVPSFNNYVAVLRAESKSQFILFCPDFRASAGYRFSGRFKSLCIYGTASIAPIRVIQGSFTYFSDVPGYTSSGYFRPRQSFFAVGLSWFFK
jgi:hypothetical protein